MKDKLEPILKGNLKVLKRCGAEVKYKEDKMLKFANWVCEGTDMNPIDLFEAIEIPVNRTIHVDELLDIFCKTSEGLASRIQTGWLKVSGRIYYLKVMKQNKNNGFNFDTREPEAHHYGTIFEKLLFGYHHDQEKSEEFFKTINHNLDLNRPISDIKFYCEKQGRVLNILGKTYKETPVVSMARQALDASKNSNGDYDYFMAKELLIALQEKRFTFATPHAIHAGKQYRSTGSCTLLSVADSTQAIMGAGFDLALHSKHGSGNGIDVSAVAAKGRYIETTEGTSDGVVNFLRIYQEVLAGFNQSGKFCLVA